MERWAESRQPPHNLTFLVSLAHELHACKVSVCFRQNIGHSRCKSLSRHKGKGWVSRMLCKHQVGVSFNMAAFLVDV
jgi:hypothetical protein